MENLFDISGKVAIVTGASSGLGMQFAKLLVENGASVAILARRKERLDELATSLQKDGGKCLPIKCDVTQENEIIECVQAVKKHFGRIDILINNAGVANGIKAEEQEKSEWERVIDANLNAVYIMAREVGKVMIEQKYGKIINIGSIHSNTVINSDVSTISAYCASKGGVQMLTKSLAVEWARYNITVNALGPSYFVSEMTANASASEEFKKFLQFRCPMKRMGQEKELNGAILYFASDASSFTTGQLLNVDGGWNCI